MTGKQSRPTTNPRQTGDGKPPGSSDQQVDATTGNPAYDIEQTPGGGSGGAPYDPQIPGSGIPRRDGGGGRDETDPKPQPPNGPRPEPNEPERKPPPIHEPEPPHDPIREPIEGDQDLGKRSERTPGRT